jgi:hypothetical protein
MLKVVTFCKDFSEAGLTAVVGMGDFKAEGTEDTSAPSALKSFLQKRIPASFGCGSAALGAQRPLRFMAAEDSKVRRIL